MVPLRGTRGTCTVEHARRAAVKLKIKISGLTSRDPGCMNPDDLCNSRACFTLDASCVKPGVQASRVSEHRERKDQGSFGPSRGLRKRWVRKGGALGHWMIITCLLVSACLYTPDGGS